MDKTQSYQATCGLFELACFALELLETIIEQL